jgi:hypothetical protein
MRGCDSLLAILNGKVVTSKVNHLASLGHMKIVQTGLFDLHGAHAPLAHPDWYSSSTEQCLEQSHFQCWGQAMSGAS